ncbi:MAG: SPOR domain-containing protein [Breznakibacter sp.]
MMGKYLPVAIFVWSMGAAVGMAQTENDIFTRLLAVPNGNEGQVELVQDNGIADLVKTHVEANKRFSSIDGFRIQVYSGSGTQSKKEAQDAKSLAMSSFPEHKVYLTFTAPFWRVRVGNFRNKSESLQMYYQLKRVFPNCYPVKDNSIRISDL